MLAIKDLNGEVHLLTGAFKIVRKRRVNGEKELSLQLKKTKQNSRFFDNIDKLWRIIDFNGEEYPILLYRDVAEGKGYVREFNCIHSFFDDMRNHFVYDTFSSSKTFDDMMAFIFNGSGYQYNIIGQFYAREFENFGDDFGLELFKTALDRYIAEFYVDGSMVNLRTKIGNTTDFQYRHKFNLESIERQVDALDFSTYGEGFGKDGLHVTYTSPLAEIYGIRPIKAIRDERYTSAESLTNRVKDAVDNSLKITLTVKLSDLRASGYNRNHPNEGDTIILVDDRLGLKVDARIVEIVELLSKSGKVIDCDVTLSNFSNVFEQQRRINNATKTIADAIDGKRPLPFEALSIAVQQATVALQNAQTELVFPVNGGIMAVSKDNPNEIVLYNSKGLGISDDGGQTFETAITGKGIVTDLLTSGSIRAGNIKIIGEDNLFYWDGDYLIAIDAEDPNKFVRLTSGELYIAGGAIKIVGGLSDSEIKSAGKWNGQGTHIDENGIYTGSLTTTQIKVGAASTFEEGYDPTKIEVGATNLAQGTSRAYKSLQLGSWTSTLHTFNIGEKIFRGDIITFRLYIKAPNTYGGRARISCYRSDGTYTTYTGPIISGGSEGYSKVTLTVANDITSIRVMIQNENAGGTASVIQYKEDKVEKGNKETDWTPAPEDIKNDLRLTAPLPSSLTLDSDGITASTGTTDKYARMDYRGFYAKKGAFAVERPDGYLLINDGIASFDLAVQSGAPPYVDDGQYADGTFFVTQHGPYMRLSSTAYRRFDYLGFKHTSRYLSISFYGRSGGGGAYTYVHVRDENGVTLATNMTNSTSDTAIGITIDLGVPTGQYRHFYIYFRGSDTAYPALLRMATKYLYG